MKFLLPILLSAVTAAAPDKQGDDVVLKALKDEMSRSVTRMHLDQYPPPYYIAYEVREKDELDILASFGALSANRRERTRTLAVDDSSRMGRTLWRGSSKALTVEDDYDAIRDEVWISTDAAYKAAVSSLSSGKSFLQENRVKDLPDSLSKEKPVVEIDPVAKLETDRQKIATNIQNLSGVFRDYPTVQKSSVELEEKAITRWFVNNEGFCHRVPINVCELAIAAAVQGPDGSVISDVETVVADNEADLPPYDQLEKKARALADRITKLAAAPEIEEYRGPILFEGEAAANLVCQFLQSNLGHAPELLRHNDAFRRPLSEKLGKKILPSFISVVDDPLSEKFGQKPIVSSYKIDDEGVKAQKITLVDHGVLKTFAMSRAPSREIKQSNGHARFYGGIAANLYLLSDKPSTEAELRKKLIDLGQEEDLTEVLIVKRLWNSYGGALESEFMSTSVKSGGRSGRDLFLPSPVEVYRLSLEDGHEELVRAASFSNLTIRVLRDIVATGDDPQAYPILRALRSFNFMDVLTVVTPSILIKEIELVKPTTQHAIPPILKNPFFEKD
jgi:predicted Zn-dependent protease